MGENTKISWCDHSFNPWIGCAKVSEGCKFCYAEARDNWLQGGHWGLKAKRQVTSPQTWNAVNKLNQKAEKAGRRDVVFTASLADIFEDNPLVLKARMDLWKLMEAQSNLDFLVLTKRPGNIIDMIPLAWQEKWPDNVMLGVSIINQKEAEAIIPFMSALCLELNCQYFISMEPLLEMINLIKIVDSDMRLPHCIIVGGESGPHARPMHPFWATALLTHSLLLGIKFHFKQWGEWSGYRTDLGDLNRQTFMKPDGTQQELPGDDFTRVLRYGKANTSNKLNGEYYMPKVFYQSMHSEPKAVKNYESVRQMAQTVQR